jgi:hypothetical protein
MSDDPTNEEAVAASILVDQRGSRVTISNASLPMSTPLSTPVWQNPRWAGPTPVPVVNQIRTYWAGDRDQYRPFAMSFFACLLARQFLDQFITSLILLRDQQCSGYW